MTQIAAGFGDEDLRVLGQRLRHLREQRQWSLKRLAEESTVSVAAIRKIELGQSNPSLLTILSLSDALGESIDRLVSAARDGEVRVTLTRGASGQSDRTRDLAEPAMRCSVVELGSRRSAPGHDTPAGADENALGYVLEGEVEVDDSGAEDQGTCRPGDAFHVSSLKRFPIKNSGRGTARLILVTDMAKEDTDITAGTNLHD
ncbi:MAG: XRE family transcriptional regulator [Pseudomonadota bacterium]